ncbi:YobI family P-loop NTPase [Microbacterium tenebrionis]|uniref:YobI family P-loop NTPase n=1 Tax=Microbacterium tenebrionis TaxID=2830665 RepID=UPI00158AEC43|nr:hypothetical protein [Microbacterium ihumii]
METQQNKLQRRIADLLESAAKAARKWGKSTAENSPIALVPLTPRYDGDSHEVYVDAIEAGLKLTDRETGVRNIALTGSYGVGKSSILAELRRRHRRRAIAISLSSLGHENDDAEGSHSRVESKTNRIQKEIVKQLLYSQDPSKLPGSKYHRVSKFKFWRELALAALIAVPVTVAFFLLGWTARLSALVQLPEELSLLPHAVVFLALLLLLFGLRYFTYNRLHISQLTAGDAGIALSPESATYFDEYLDEIVYYFENIKRNIVIFEDIDRFDDAGIFETLRSLNAILNSARQLNGRNVRFIYAIKDSVFDELGARAADEEAATDDVGDADAGRDDAAEVQVARANRTKFFDLVIPVVPFITHRSARDLLADVLEDVHHSVSPELIDLTARHVADMRLIKNIRNEFLIFKRQVIEKGSLDLSENGVFAMMLYKSTHLADFEAIRYGRSDLDTVYAYYRDLVNDNVKELDTRIGQNRRALRALRPPGGRGARLGVAFTEYIDQMMRLQGGSRLQYSYQGAVVSSDDLSTDSLWERIADAEDAITVTYRSQYNHHSMQVPHADLESIVGEALRTSEWTEAERTRATDAIAADTNQRDWLIGAEMSGLMAAHNYKVTIGKKAISFEQAVTDTLKSELAVELVRTGHIDEDFTLYTSTFHASRVSANATNFLMKRVNRHRSDPTFALTAQDAEAVLRERPEVLAQRAAHNIALLDYIIGSDHEGLDEFVSRLTQSDAEQRAFLHLYLQRGVFHAKLVSLLAERWIDTLVLIVEDEIIDDERRMSLVNVALDSLPPDLEFTLNADVSAILNDAYASLDTFSSDSTSPARASSLADLVARAELQLKDLAPLGASVRTEIVSRGTYTVTRQNLLLALGDPDLGLDLDTVWATNEKVYRSAIQDIHAYLDALASDEVTATDSDHFAARVGDVHASAPDQVNEFVRRASDVCVVAELPLVPSATWPSLAEHGGRFPLTVPNVAAYVDQYDIDEHLGALLSAAAGIETTAQDEGDAKATLSLEILKARNFIPSAALRAALVKSLELESYIEPDEVPREIGELVGHLIAGNDLEDAASAFAALVPGDVGGLVFALSKSKQALGFVSPTEIPPTVLVSVLEHNDVTPVMKDAIIERFAEFTDGASTSVLSGAGRFAVRTGRAITIDQILRLAQNRVASATVVGLLELHRAELTWAEIRPVLQALGGKYAELTEHNGKRPSFDADAAHLALAERLRSLGAISTTSERGGRLVINMPRLAR